MPIITPDLLKLDQRPGDTNNTVQVKTCCQLQTTQQHEVKTTGEAPTRNTSYHASLDALFYKEP